MSRIKKEFKRQGIFYTYILRCKDGTYYTGYTSNIKKRVALHNAGRGAKYTRDRRPVKLVWKKRYKYFKYAFLREKIVKTLTRAQKAKLIRPKKNKRK